MNGEQCTFGFSAEQATQNATSLGVSPEIRVAAP